MAPKSKSDEIQSMQTPLRDEPSDTKVGPPASGSIEELNV